VTWKEPFLAMKPGPNAKRIFWIGAIVLGLSVCLSVGSVSAQTDDKHPVVVLDTSEGPITLELDREKAPITVDNFLKYVDDGFYDNLIFHRVIPRFMIQGGGFDSQLREKQEGQRGKIKNEAGNGLTNARGSIAMARTPDVDSAQNQFFINLADNDFLDNPRSPYAVFGKVTDGMNVVDKIAQVATADRGRNEKVPVKPVIIKTARRKTKS
jgi:peptidyl-prolyl cis-trans isomerase A (cyclophilin A)